MYILGLIKFLVFEKRLFIQFLIGFYVMQWWPSWISNLSKKYPLLVRNIPTMIAM